MALAQTPQPQWQHRQNQIRRHNQRSIICASSSLILSSFFFWLRVSASLPLPLLAGGPGRPPVVRRGRSVPAFFFLGRRGVALGCRFLAAVLAWSPGGGLFALLTPAGSFAPLPASLVPVGPLRSPPASVFPSLPSAFPALSSSQRRQGRQSDNRPPLTPRGGRPRGLQDIFTRADNSMQSSSILLHH